MKFEFKTPLFKIRIVIIIDILSIFFDSLQYINNIVKKYY